MRQQNMSLSRLASAAQCSKSFISHLLSGRRNTCTDGLADRIAAALDVPTRVIFVPSKSTTDRQADYQSLSPESTDPPSELGRGAPETRPGPGPARSQNTERTARLVSRHGWVPRRALLGSRGRAVEWPSGSLHRRPSAGNFAEPAQAPEATAHLLEVTHPCSFEAARR